MKRIDFYRLISHIASGIALFISAGGAVWGFFTYFSTSLFAAFAAAAVGIVPGIFLLLISEGFFLLSEILNEKKEQTKLLESINEILEKQ